jgi:DNA-nicking Smr family endonuclease
MSPEDLELWKKVTEGLVPLLPKTSAPAIRPDALVIQRPRARQSEIDLHGLTIQQACVETRQFITDAKAAGLRHVTIITGLSGYIRREFPFWVDQLPEVRKIEPFSGGGAFKVYLKRDKRRA